MHGCHLSPGDTDLSCREPTFYAQVRWGEDRNVGRGRGVYQACVVVYIVHNQVTRESS